MEVARVMLYKTHKENKKSKVERLFARILFFIF